VTREELFARATDPGQYDTPGLDWPREGSLSSPSTQFFHRYLREELGDIRDRSVVDIGCGTGHLYSMFERLGAGRVVGLEPSERNAAIARRQFPGLEVVAGTLQDSDLGSPFDLAVAVMSFEHQPDLRAAFRRVASLLEPSGRFFLVAGDQAFHLTPRFGLILEAHAMPDGSTVVATRYPYGTLHDVIRPIEHHEHAARMAGFVVQRKRAMVPTRELLDVDSRWQAFEGRAVAHLLVLGRREA